MVQALWRGDVEHNGAYWPVLKSMSCPRSVQKDVPVWVAACAPIIYDYAVRNNQNIMSWSLAMSIRKPESNRDRLVVSKARLNPNYTGKFTTMRHSAVSKTKDDCQAVLSAIRIVFSQFNTLMMTRGSALLC